MPNLLPGPWKRHLWKNKKWWLATIFEAPSETKCKMMYLFCDNGSICAERHCWPLLCLLERCMWKNRKSHPTEVKKKKNNLRLVRLMLGFKTTPTPFLGRHFLKAGGEQPYGFFAAFALSRRFKACLKNYFLSHAALCGEASLDLLVNGSECGVI